MNQVPTAPTLSALVRAQAIATPDAPALIAGDVKWTYAQLETAVEKAAAGLSRLGVEAGDRVALLETNTADWLAVALGIHRLGARVDAFNTWVRAWDLDYLLEASRCRVLVTTSAVRSADLLGELRQLLPELWESPSGQWRSQKYPHLRQVAVLGDADVPSGAYRWNDVVADAEPVDAADSDGDAIAYVLYTSGSTARPKAVPLLQRDVIINAFHIGERMGLTADDRIWLGSPLFWSFGAANALVATLSHGACLVLQEHFSAAEAADLMAETRCNAAYLLPSIVDALLPVAQQVRDIDELRTGVTIGRPEEVRRIYEDLNVEGICNVYGSTETYGNCCVTDTKMPVEDRLSCQGEPLPGVELRVLDENGTYRYGDADGELQVRGRVTPGYLDDSDAVDQAFTDDGWYRTGDRIRLRPDGTVEFLARLTDMIKTSGINVAPAEVESFLCLHPGVDSAIVVGAPHPARGEVVVAFVTPHSQELEAETLRQYCKQGIAGYKVPWEIVIVDQLPSTETGKIKRRALVDEATQRVAATVDGG